MEGYLCSWSNSWLLGLVWGWNDLKDGVELANTSFWHDALLNDMALKYVFLRVASRLNMQCHGVLEDKALSCVTSSILAANSALD
ncbi:hypothetical protein RIF29_26008 [Crotalaria pallida]|uniref:Uncharacterized protein n=1 Tax=Crotalaria pallida TaxID=3830 RepID=A0AAN9I050_CROPI